MPVRKGVILMYIKSALLAFCLLIVIACQHESPQAGPRLLIENAYIFTMEPDQLRPFMGYLRVDAIHGLAIILIGPGRVRESRPLSGKRR